MSADHDSYGGAEADPSRRPGSNQPANQRPRRFSARYLSHPGRLGRQIGVNAATTPLAVLAIGLVFGATITALALGLLTTPDGADVSDNPNEAEHWRFPDPPADPSTK